MFAVTADWHQRKAVQGRAPDMTGDAAYGLEQVVDFCVSERPTALLALGDNTDSDKPDGWSVRHMCRQFDRLEAAKVPVYYVRGQHDGSDPAHDWMAVHPWPRHIHGTLVEVDGLQIYGLDYQPHGTLGEALERLPRAAFCLACHLTWADFVGSGECRLAEVPPQVKIVMTGDYHVHLTKTISRDGADDLLVVSPGPLCRQSWGEEPKKAFFVMDSGRLRSVPLRGRPQADLFVLSPESLAHVISLAPELCRRDEGLPGAVQRPAVRVRYASDVPGAHDALVEAFGSAHLFLEVMPDRGGATDTAPDLEGEGAVEETLLRDELARRGDPGGYDLVVRMASSRNPGAELAAAESEFLSGGPV